MLGGLENRFVICILFCCLGEAAGERGGGVLVVIGVGEVAVGERVGVVGSGGSKNRSVFWMVCIFCPSWIRLLVGLRMLNFLDVFRVTQLVCVKLVDRELRDVLGLLFFTFCLVSSSLVGLFTRAILLV